MKIKVGVIFGGKSVEHEISIISALQAINNIDEYKYDVIPIYISKNKYWYTGNALLNHENYKDLEMLLKKCDECTLVKKKNEFCLVKTNGILNRVLERIDVVLPIVHGKNVEDGSLAGYLETIGIPFVGSKVLGASIGQDKVITKEILKTNNIPVVDYIWFYDYEFLDKKADILNSIKKIGFPVIVKPASLGSSIGINFVKNDKVLEDAINEAIEYDKKVIVEKCVDNLVEVNCSVVGNYESAEASVLEEVLGDDEVLSYNDKYIGGKTKGIVNTKRIIPANVSKKLADDIKQTSIEVFRVLNFSGVVRIDYLINKETGEYYVNEPNTIPGSLSFYLWNNTNKTYKELLDELLSLSIKEYKDNNKKVFSFKTNILKSFNGIKSVKK